MSLEKELLEMPSPVPASPRIVLPSKLPDTILLIGWALLALSFTVFVISDVLAAPLADPLAVFCVHYGIALLYVFVLMYDKSIGVLKGWRKENISKTIICLLLFLVSCCIESYGQRVQGIGSMAQHSADHHVAKSAQLSLF